MSFPPLKEGISGVEISGGLDSMTSAGTSPGIDIAHSDMAQCQCLLIESSGEQLTKRRVFKTQDVGSTMALILAHTGHDKGNSTVIWRKFRLQVIA